MRFSSSRRTCDRLFESSLLFLSFCYTFILLVILSTSASRQKICSTLKNLDSQHTCRPAGRTRPEKGCSSWGAFYSALDRYAVAHVAGFLTKGLVHPQRRTLWAAALLFEAVEYILGEVYMPFLKECWWDRLILDVLICNMIGMELGIFLTRRYNFTYYHKYNNSESHPGRTLIVIIVIAVTMAATDVNFFLIRESIHLRMQSYLHYLRVLFLIALSIPARRQLQLISTTPTNSKQSADRYRHRYPTHLVAYIIITSLEAITSVRVGRGPYTAETPTA